MERRRGRPLVARRVRRPRRQRMGGLAQRRGRDREAPPVATPVPSTVVPSLSYSVTVLPASAVPSIVSVVSFEQPFSPPRRSPAPRHRSRYVITGAAGAVVSMVTWNAVEAAPWLPAASRRLRRQCYGRPRPAPWS